MAAVPALNLYAFWRTSATFRVRVALNLKNLPVTETFINMDAGEQRSEAYLKINPLGGLPTLVEAGHPPITQSLAILEFLEETQPLPALLPADRHGRARVRSLCNMLAADTHPLITPRVKKYLTTEAGFDDAAWRRWQTQWFTTGLAAVEQRLSTEAQTGLYCHGDTVGMADICLASVVAVMRVFKIEVHNIPTVDAIVARCSALDAFVRAEPARQVGAPVQ
ncbi:maleylacetoacetate isomerase [Rhodoferax lacus]|uniref:Maleylacetoacetate isomerase n=1 Tax=Rhodoferax lacus TaxID=2184758 RepID=A0A3E1RBC5_9BURK|nr:maleylacetoacetate isomerase [Rhodoferax lacus]RFO96521.1 maleylacetoacetate isomerase [Rhodoferax lacus]